MSQAFGFITRHTLYAPIFVYPADMGQVRDDDGVIIEDFLRCHLSILYTLKRNLLII